MSEVVLTAAEIHNCRKQYNIDSCILNNVQLKWMHLYQQVAVQLWPQSWNIKQEDLDVLCDNISSKAVISFKDVKVSDLWSWHSTAKRLRVWTSLCQDRPTVFCQ